MRVGLFVTCLVDAVRPEIGFAALKLLEAAGFDVVVPEAQTCCGQPAYNSGDVGTARELAGKVLREFEGFDYVVVPSGSCGGGMRRKIDRNEDRREDLTGWRRRGGRRRVFLAHLVDQFLVELAKIRVLVGALDQP